MQKITNPFTELGEGQVVRLESNKKAYSSLSRQVIKIIKLDGDYAIVELLSELIVQPGYRTEIYIPDWTFSKPESDYVEVLSGEEWPDEL